MLDNALLCEIQALHDEQGHSGSLEFCTERLCHAAREYFGADELHSRPVVLFGLRRPVVALA